MKKWLVLGTAILLSLPGPNGEVEAQTVATPSKFDIGVYAGGSWTGDWFQSRSVIAGNNTATENDEGEGWGIGFNPAFGGQLTWWALPKVGIRLHGAYIPSFIPTAEEEEGPGFFEGDRPLNNWFYDANIAFRPWYDQVGGSSLMTTMYFFLGGGAMEAGLQGDGEGCEPTVLAAGACLSYDSDIATVGQGTVGLGFDFFSLTNSIGLFAELAAHGYNSPTHVDDEFLPPITVPVGTTVNVGDEKIGITTRFVGGLKLALGGGVETTAMAPPPPPPPPPPPAPAPPAQRQINVCVIQGGMPQNVAAMYNPATQDTMVSGQAFAARYPTSAPTYAAGTTWFAQSDSLTIGDQNYVRFGVTRVIQPPQLAAAGNYQGTAVFAENGAETPYPVVYVPVRPGCEFQPYRLREDIRPRG